MTAKISQLKEKNKDVVQKVALLEHKYDNIINVLIDEKETMRYIATAKMQNDHS